MPKGNLVWSRPPFKENGIAGKIGEVTCGAVAQLGERLVRNEEASGSIPLSSTKSFPKVPQRRASPRYSACMAPKSVSLLFFALNYLSCVLLSAQDKSVRDRYAQAHGQYYTPTTSGLKSFRCEATIDWKSMFARFSGNELTDDNPGLKYLRTVHLAVADELKGKGTLEWNSAGDPPASEVEPVEKMREGLQTAVAGFFQAWNVYLNGSMAPLPDNSVMISEMDEGIHMSASGKDLKVDEDFDKNMVLTQVQVVTPSLKVLALPTFSETPDGLILSTVISKIYQPPTAPESEATFHVEYAKVESFLIPSLVVLDIRNVGRIDLSLNACQVTVADWARKP
jgi:hypothetical protein